MKILINENQLELVRRYEKLIVLVNNGIDVLNQSEDLCDYTYGDFIEEVCWQVSDNMDELNLSTEEVGAIEKVHQWVRNYLGLHIREEFDRIIDEHNCDEGFDDADEDYLGGLMYGVDNVQESKTSNSSNLMNSLKRRIETIYELMDKYFWQEIDCEEWEENEFEEYICEYVTDELMFNEGVDSWDWDELNNLIREILDPKIKQMYNSWRTKNC